MAQGKTSTIILADGRTLGYATYGASFSSSLHLPIFYFHGFPSSRLECGVYHKAAESLNVHLIALDRPGMGLSTFQENRQLLDWPKDVLAVADHLGIKEFGVLGLSGGGPYALACLKAISKDRLKAGAAISSVYPTDLGTSGMMMINQVLFWFGRWAPWFIAPVMEWQLGSVARDQPERYSEILKDDLTGESRPLPDRECCQRIFEDPDLWQPFVESVRESFRESSRGAAWEAKLYGSEWDFSLSQVDSSRLTIWHGALDINVPVKMADMAAEIMRGAKYKRFDNEAHTSLLFGHSEDILASMIVEMQSEE